MNNKKLESLVNKLTNNIKNTKPNTIYHELIGGQLFTPLSKVIDAKSFVILSFLIYFKKHNKYTEGMSTVIDNDLYTFSLIAIDQMYTEWECDECYGDGYTQCYHCDGSGEETCLNCDGSGKEECVECNGDGENEDGGTCQPCDGDGYLECDECAGRGYSRCQECDGSGSEDCSYCDGQGRGENEDRYEVTQVLYASINRKLFNLLNDLEEDEVISEEVDSILHDLKLTIPLNTKSYETEYFVNYGFDDLETDDVVMNHLIENPNLVYSPSHKYVSDSNDYTK